MFPYIPIYYGIGLTTLLLQKTEHLFVMPLDYGFKRAWSFALDAWRCFMGG